MCSCAHGNMCPWPLKTGRRRYRRAGYAEAGPPAGVGYVWYLGLLNEPGHALLDRPSSAGQFFPWLVRPAVVRSRSGMDPAILDAVEHFHENLRIRPGHRYRRICGPENKIRRLRPLARPGLQLFYNLRVHYNTGRSCAKQMGSTYLGLGYDLLLGEPRRGLV